MQATVLYGPRDIRFDCRNDDIGLLGCICWRHDSQAICLGLLTALAACWQTHYYITAIVTHVKRMRMALAAVTNDGYMFALDKLQVCICIVINICHIVSSLVLSTAKAQNVLNKPY